MAINQTELRAYQERWKAVVAVEAAEQQAATVGDRWLRLNALLRMAAGLGITAQKDDEEIAVVRGRWNRLKNLYLSKLEDETRESA